MFSAIQSLFFWSVILTGVFFAGRMSVTNDWLNGVLAENKSKALNKFNDTVKDQVKEQIENKKNSVTNKSQNQSKDMPKTTSKKKVTSKTAQKAGSQVIKKDRVYAGVPRGKKVTLLYNPGFIVGYSEQEKSPLWVAYRVGQNSQYQNFESPKNFMKDKRVNTLSHQALKARGYVGVQMASELGMTTRYGRQAQLHTYLTSNVCLQRENLHESLWKQLDDKIVNRYASQNEEVWVITGPIYSSQSKRLSSGARVPDQFFKIIVDEKENSLDVMAFIFNQSDQGHDLSKYLTTVDMIEKKTGLDFFTKLYDSLEQRIEAQKLQKIW